MTGLFLGNIVRFCGRFGEQFDTVCIQVIKNCKPKEIQMFIINVILFSQGLTSYIGRRQNLSTESTLTVARSRSSISMKSSKQLIKVSYEMVSQS